ncbi:MAG TPA: Rrf2 family transcriptional regulator [Bryobacteraceae bacterium]|nr:Rrf2 family transcriptional regulator [Bryobacteraceae bacterium]
MQLTRAADYAVRVMIHLATLPPGTRVNRDTLAEAADVPAHFLAKVLQSLGHARLILAHRGISGGFSLAAPPEQISVLRVVEAIEGPIQLNVCLSVGGCGRQGWCPAHLVWAEAQAALTQVLGSASIAKLARESGGRRQDKVVYPWN